MPDWLTSPWGWLILGLILIAIEAIAPGIFMIWFGVAALLTALIDWAFGWSWQVNAAVFAILALLSAFAGWRFSRHRDEEIGDTPMLNRRAEALVGRIFQLDQAIIAGAGRIRVDDSVWRVSGPDLPAGAQVRVSRVDGANLIVEAAEAKA